MREWFCTFNFIYSFKKLSDSIKLISQILLGEISNKSFMEVPNLFSLSKEDLCANFLLLETIFVTSHLLPFLTANSH